VLVPRHGLEAGEVKGEHRMPWVLLQPLASEPLGLLRVSRRRTRVTGEEVLPRRDAKRLARPPADGEHGGSPRPAHGAPAGGRGGEGRRRCPPAPSPPRRRG